ncbi:SpoIIE family protein phosphatase [Nonomuraea fuscirosea]|uniref:SpoIIE family protein phosphatase n=1 Tax=Nonomuraea fuscirosea TaxID=1291556 RepID=UPI003405B722
MRPFEPRLNDGMTAAELVPAFLVVNTAGTIIGWTAATERLTGYTADEVLGRPGTRLLPPADRSGWLRRLKEEERLSGLSEILCRDGHSVLVRAEGAKMLTALAGDAWLVSLVPAIGDLFGGAGSLLERLLTHFPVAMAFWDRDLRCVWRNAAAESLEPAFPHYRIGASLHDPIAGYDTTTIRETMRGVLETGKPAVDREARAFPADGRGELTLSISLFRLDGVEGQPLGICSLALDISRSQARDRLTLLREAGIRIGSTLDVKRTAQELADLAVPILADYVTVDLGEEVMPGSEPLQRLTATSSGIPVFRRAGVASVHDDAPESLWPRGHAVFVPPSSPFTKVLDSGESHFEPVMNTRPGSWLDEDPDRARMIHHTGMHSLIIVPLKARGELLGVAVFVRHENAQPFTTDDLLLAEELVARAALSLDNARRYTRERNAALALQRNLLPSNLDGGGTLEVASHYLPSDMHEGVGGDWFDAIRLDDSRLALVVGDVTGHGIDAAATMGRLRTAVRTLAYLGLRPHELLARLDDLVARLSDEEAADGEPRDATGATCLYAVYDPATRRCTMATAGHPPPAVMAPSGEVHFPNLPSGTPIGLGVGSFESLELELAPGTVLALYTDGLIETRQADLDAGMDRLGTALAGAALPLNDLCAHVIDTIVGDTPAEDDIALLMARVPHKDPPS